MALSCIISYGKRNSMIFLGSVPGMGGSFYSVLGSPKGTSGSTGAGAAAKADGLGASLFPRSSRGILGSMETDRSLPAALQLILGEIRDLRKEAAGDRKRADAERKQAEERFEEIVRRGEEDRFRAEEDRSDFRRIVLKTVGVGRTLQGGLVELLRSQREILKGQKAQTAILRSIAASLRIHPNGRNGNGRGGNGHPPKRR